MQQHVKISTPPPLSLTKSLGHEGRKLHGGSRNNGTHRLIIGLSLPKHVQAKICPEQDFTLFCNLAETLYKCEIVHLRQLVCLGTFKGLSAKAAICVTFKFVAALNTRLTNLLHNDKARHIRVNKNYIHKLKSL